MDLIPSSNSSYKDVNYWNDRYTKEDSYDWFKSYDAFKHLIKACVSSDDRILMLGCGNSKLSELMYEDGYRNIVNVDYSEVVINRMKEKCMNMAGMTWEVMDIRSMSYSDESFDIVIEKGTLDAMLVDDSPWHISEENSALIDTILTQVSRILKDQGRFISVTFTQPHFRIPMLINRKYEWDVEQKSFGEFVQYFFYLCTKGRPLSESLINKYKKAAS
ncbi:EEF1A lysine methyltransferase 4-like [Ischnura elegans]|uniref:EEF1A lysine methyltransferase 4-like n=1 Tax=Ischnura elegans TaxID=197161 RepID=UPI001ED87680|nr:EEF1A lysine methyltransferase 4-like [Ischnura elegans]